MGCGGPSADALRSSNFTFYMARHSDLNRLSSPSIYVIYVYILPALPFSFWHSHFAAASLCALKYSSLNFHVPLPFSKFMTLLCV